MHFYDDFQSFINEVGKARFFELDNFFSNLMMESVQLVFKTRVTDS